MIRVDGDEQRVELDEGVLDDVIAVVNRKRANYVKPGEIARMRELAGKGYRITEIAALTGRAYNTVASHVREAGAAQRRLSAREREKAVSRYRAGEKARKVAQDFGVSTNTLYRWARAEERDRRRFDRERRERAEQRAAIRDA